MGCHDVRPLLAARVEELSPLEARIRAEHVATCPRCAAEAAAYGRVVQALAAMAALEAEPIAGTLERALVATVVVARALRQRRRAPGRPSPVPSLVGLAAPALIRAK